MNGRPIEAGRELELQTAKESIDYMRNVLKVGLKQQADSGVSSQLPVPLPVPTEA